MKQILSERSSGPKPVIADLNAAEAEANIRRKLAIVAEALAQSTRPAHVRSAWAPDLSMALANRVLPTTVRQFNLWDIKDLLPELRKQLPAFRRNASVTLKRHTQLHTSVEDVVLALRKALIAPTPESRREFTVASLRRRIGVANTMRQIAEREFVESRQEVRRLKELLAHEVARRAAVERESKEAIQKLEAQLTKVSAQKGSSGSAISKLVLAPGAQSD
jgi:hypothetical protein